MPLDPQIVGPGCGAIVAASGAILAICRVILSLMRERARARWLAASPSDRLLLGDIPPPYPAAGVAPLILLLLGGALAIGVPFLRGEAHPIVTLERLGLLGADVDRAVRRGDFNPDLRPIAMPVYAIGGL